MAKSLLTNLKNKIKSCCHWRERKCTVSFPFSSGWVYSVQQPVTQSIVAYVILRPGAGWHLSALISSIFCFITLCILVHTDQAFLGGLLSVLSLPRIIKCINVSCICYLTFREILTPRAGSSRSLDFQMHGFGPRELIITCCRWHWVGYRIPIYVNYAPNLLKLTPRPLFFTPVQASAGSK
jgi:hypothetical protein